MLNSKILIVSGTTIWVIFQNLVRFNKDCWLWWGIVVLLNLIVILYQVTYVDKLKDLVNDAYDHSIYQQGILYLDSINQI